MTDLWQDQARLHAENDSLKTRIENHVEQLFQTVNQLLEFHHQLKKERHHTELLTRLAARQQELLVAYRREAGTDHQLLEQLAASLDLTARQPATSSSELEEELRRLARLTNFDGEY